MLLVGTQTSGTSKGIYSYSFESATGELGTPGLAAEADNPTFLALSPNGRSLLVANELDHYEGKSGGAVSSYTIDRANARLIKVNEVASQGGGTCHVAFDHTGQSAFARTAVEEARLRFSWGGRAVESAVSFSIPGHGADEKRQKAPHAHRVTVSPDNRFLLVNDLGLGDSYLSSGCGDVNDWTILRRGNRLRGGASGTAVSSGRQVCLLRDGDDVVGGRAAMGCTAGRARDGAGGGDEAS